MAPQVGGQLFCVHVPTSNSNFKTTPNLQKFPISINVTNPLRKTIYLQISPKNHQKIYKTAQNIDMWDEHRDS